MWGAIIGAGASLLGGALSNSAQSRANQANINLNRENRDWQEYMSNSAYRRAVEDMKAAGLNPMLAYSQGGASSPNSSAATVQPEAAMGEAVNSAGSRIMQAASLKKLQAEAESAEEKAEQDRITTDEMKATSASGTGSRLRGMQLDVEGKEANLNLTKAIERLRNTDLSVRQLEEQIMEETLPYAVSSAKSRAELLGKEVDLAGIKQILMNLEIPERKAIATWFEAVGAGSPAAKAVMSIGQWLRLILGGR